ncbi:glycosyltransferase family 9 protein [Ancylomarina longa]|uniref:Glycosyltransferase family 9 protein n=1 Tax=Ancylomarina longa TaxID=2487017 RepID=A0A434B011_9BACT|nr:glycosyltransferase family 9 protein [Ancylomarina longa]RUT80095.1 glycosyltransferase family 9 protein [Ancylomarina longa]
MKKRVAPLADVRNIIIRLPNFLGDSINCSPAIKLLIQEYPNAQFTIVCRKPSEALFKSLPSLGNIIIDDTKARGNRFFKTIKLIFTIRKKKYDLGILFHNSFLSALIFKFSRIKHVIGYNNESRKFLLDFWIKMDRSRHYINHYANLINKYLEDKYLELPALNIWSNGKKVDFGFNNEFPVIGLALGCDEQGARAYPQKESLELIKLLLEQNRFNLVLIGDSREQKRNDIYMEMLTSPFSKNIQNYSGKTDVGTHINIIKKLDLLITIDSSAMHIAAAVNTPFIAVLGHSTSAFCIVKPKVNSGRYMKNENGLIDEDLFISQIKPSEILNEISLLLNKNQVSAITHFKSNL